MKLSLRYPTRGKNLTGHLDFGHLHRQTPIWPGGQHLGQLQKKAAETRPDTGSSVLPARSGASWGVYMGYMQQVGWLVLPFPQGSLLCSTEKKNLYSTLGRIKEMNLVGIRLK